MNKFNEKFANDDTHHSFCLTSDGCFKRHNRPRSEEIMTKSEDRRAELNTFSYSENQERQLINKVAYLQSIGCQLQANETLEDYVDRNLDKLEEK